MKGKLLIIVGSVLSFIGVIVICALAFISTAFSNGDIAGRRQDELTSQEIDSLISANNTYLILAIIAGGIFLAFITAALIIGIGKNKTLRKLKVGIGISIIPIVFYFGIIMITIVGSYLISGIYLILGIFLLIPFISSVLVLIGIIMERRVLKADLVSV